MHRLSTNQSDINICSDDHWLMLVQRSSILKMCLISITNIYQNEHTVTAQAVFENLIDSLLQKQLEKILFEVTKELFFAIVGTFSFVHSIDRSTCMRCFATSFVSDSSCGVNMFLLPRKGGIIGLTCLSFSMSLIKKKTRSAITSSPGSR